jgi:hypothetical protein
MAIIEPPRGNAGLASDVDTRVDVRVDAAGVVGAGVDVVGAAAAGAAVVLLAVAALVLGSSVYERGLGAPTRCALCAR